jgi:hypothetical protein
MTEDKMKCLGEATARPPIVEGFVRYNFFALQGTFLRYSVSGLAESLLRRGEMASFDHAPVGRVRSDPTTDAEARLAPGIAILVIGALSLLSWALLTSLAMVLWSAL